MRRIAALMASTLLACTMGVVIAPSASALHSQSCAGTRIFHHPVKDGTELLAYLDSYYSSTNGGTNCVKLILVSGHFGITHDMEARIVRCNTGNPNTTCSTRIASTYTTSQFDRGNYEQYAGPVHVQNTDGLCVAYVGQIYSHNGNTGESGAYASGATMCG